jgi:hypothetical protein
MKYSKKQRNEYIGNVGIFVRKYKLTLFLIVGIVAITLITVNSVSAEDKFKLKCPPKLGDIPLDWIPEYTGLVDVRQDGIHVAVCTYTISHKVGKPEIFASVLVQWCEELPCDNVASHSGHYVNDVWSKQKYALAAEYIKYPTVPRIKDAAQEFQDLKKDLLAQVEGRAVYWDDEFSEEDFEGIIPDDTSCKDFGVEPKDFDLAYDKEMLNKEFKDFLEEYSSKHNLRGGSGKFSGCFINYRDLFFHLGYIDDENFLTGKENELGKRIRERSKKEGTLTPAQVFEESLKLNDDCVFDALLTAHNFLRNDANKYRDETKYKEQLIIAETKSRDAVTPEDKKIAEERIKEIKDKLKKNENVFGNLKEIRKSDNVGAWYHLFGVLSASYAHPVTSKFAVWWEHRQTKSKLDKLEYCWDSWAIDLGIDIANTMSIKERKDRDRYRGQENVIFFPLFIKQGYDTI